MIDTAWLMTKIGATMAAPSLLIMLGTILFFDSGGRYEFIKWQQNIISWSFIGTVFGVMLMLGAMWQLA